MGMDYDLSELEELVSADKSDPHSASNLQGTYPYLTDREAKIASMEIALIKKKEGVNTERTNTRIFSVIDGIAKMNGSREYAHALELALSPNKGPKVRNL